jgi:hypothetical protein
MSIGQPPPERPTESGHRDDRSAERLPSRDELRQFTQGLIRELASDLAREVLHQLAAAPETRAFARLPYNCTGAEYICVNAYTCSDLSHRCTNSFLCPGTYACNIIHVGFGGGISR